MSQPQIEIKPPITAIKAIIRVQGFNDARKWIYRLIDDGVACCADCEKPATHVHWVDRAEWYCQCEDHRQHHEQWVGHTGWNPSKFSKILVKDKAQAWFDALSPEEKALVKLKEFDATDYWDLLVDYSEPVLKHYFSGDEQAEWAHFVKIMALKDGRFAYEIRRLMGPTCYCYELTAPFPSIEEALEAAKKEASK